MASRRAPRLPLAGIRIVEIAHHLAAPIAAMHLADFGADVVKVESLEGDDWRRWGPRSPIADSLPFLAVNRNKRSLSLQEPLDRRVAQGPHRRGRARGAGEGAARALHGSATSGKPHGAASAPSSGRPHARDGVPGRAVGDSREAPGPRARARPRQPSHPGRARVPAAGSRPADRGGSRPGVTEMMDMEGVRGPSGWTAPGGRAGAERGR